MNAHKVPATYCNGWEIPNSPDRFYIFTMNNLHSNGTNLRYRHIKKLKPEHSYFIAKDFYYIDWSIKGIAFKVKNEISEFLKNSQFSIKCVDDLADVVEDGEIQYVTIDNYDKFISYQIHIDNWIISSASGDAITPADFKKALNDYVFNKVGVLIEENYFANYLESMWNDLKFSIMNEVAVLDSGEKIVLSRKMDILEFFVVQYLRCDKRIETDIEPIIEKIKEIFVDIDSDGQIISDLVNDGILTSKIYFYAILLDAARGNKSKIMSCINNIDKNYYVDVLQAPAGFSYITSNIPCVFSKIVNGSKEEMLFPIQNNFCLRFRKKHHQSDFGKYVLQTSSEVKCINNSIISGGGDIVISEHENIAFLI